jgi:uncharacterized protein
MTRDEAITKLQAAYPALQREFPLRSLALFGSFARGEARPDSDIDVLVEFQEGARVTLFTFSYLLDRLTDILGDVKIDIVENHPGLSESFRAAIQRDIRRVA